MVTASDNKGTGALEDPRAGSSPVPAPRRRTGTPKIPAQRPHRRHGSGYSDGASARREGSLSAAAPVSSVPDLVDAWIYALLAGSRCGCEAPCDDPTDDCARGVREALLALRDAVNPDPVTSFLGLSVLVNSAQGHTGRPGAALAFGVGLDQLVESVQLLSHGEDTWEDIADYAASLLKQRWDAPRQ